MQKGRRGQMWISDFTISLLLFVFACLIAAKIVMNSSSSNTVFSELKSDGSKMSEILLSEGYPINWTNISVIRPGLFQGNRLDSIKIAKAMNLSQTNYSMLKPKLQTNYDFLVIFEDKNGDAIEFGNLCSIGNPAIPFNYTDVSPGVIDCHYPEFDGVSYDNMMKIVRLAVLDSRIVKMAVYVWQ